MNKTGAEIVIECLIKEKVEILFGIPGGVLLPIFDVLYDAPFKFILTRHEQGAAHMADGYARATGKVGVCIATSGPGATNLATGLATAYMDSIPMVAITGQVASQLVGNDAFQEADTTGVTRSITKHNFMVRNIKELAPTIAKAFYIARTGRQGPVVVDIPTDITKQSCEFIYPENVKMRSYNPVYKGHPQQIQKVIELIKKSRAPVVYAGGGIISSGASKEFSTFVDKLGIPVTLTLLGLGAYPADSELFLGMLGMHGTYYANHAIQNSDLIIAIGARFDDRITGKVDEFAPKAAIVHIDIDPTSIGKNIKTDLPIVGDAKEVLQELNKLIAKEKIKLNLHDWYNTINKWKKDSPLIYKHDDKLRPQYVIEKIHEVTGGKAIIATEVGQNQMWTAQFFKFSYPRQLLTSGGLGTMGYGFPAAIGARFGMPDKVVFNIAGDGSIQMNIQELATAVYNKVPVKVAILNNGCLGMVRQWQELFFNKRYSGVNLKCANPDFVKLAEAYGAVGIRITKKKEVVPALKKALTTENVVFLDFQVEQEENVWPMVPSGKPLHEILRGLA